MQRKKAEIKTIKQRIPRIRASFWSPLDTESNTWKRKSFKNY